MLEAFCSREYPFKNHRIQRHPQAPGHDVIQQVLSSLASSHNALYRMVDGLRPLQEEFQVSSCNIALIYLSIIVYGITALTAGAPRSGIQCMPSLLLSGTGSPGPYSVDEVQPTFW